MEPLQLALVPNTANRAPSGTLSNTLSIRLLKSPGFRRFDEVSDKVRDKVFKTMQCEKL